MVWFLCCASDFSENESDDYKSVKLEEEMYKFNANKLPSSRNVFYQICDIDDEDVQSLIRSDDGAVKDKILTKHVALNLLKLLKINQSP